jgi:hypothetical protein
MVGSVTGNAYAGMISAQQKLVESAHVIASAVIPGGDQAAAHATLTPASATAPPGPQPPAGGILPPAETLPHGTLETAAVDRVAALHAYKANAAVVKTAIEVSDVALDMLRTA